MKGDSQWGPGIIERLYGLMLYAYPKAFRMRFYAEMRQGFRDAWREASRSPGLEPRIGFIFALLDDWVRSSANERMVSMRIMISRRWDRRVALRLAVGLGMILACFFVSTTFLKAYIVPGSSMESSLHRGDHVLVKNIGANGEINRGDVIIFRYPADPNVVLVKRVIGVSGDRVRLMKKRVIRNGVPLVEAYAQHHMPFDPVRDNFPAKSAAVSALIMPRAYDMLTHHVASGEVVVPPGMLFVLGDNRDNSIDSRLWGLLPRENVIGEAMLVYWGSNAHPSLRRLSGAAE
jgi:signal peptidase I